MSEENAELIYDDNDDDDDDDDHHHHVEKCKSALKVSSKSVDNRILWIQNKVMNFLGLEDSHLDLFDNLLMKDDNYYENKLMDFLNDNLYCQTDLHKKLIFFYKTYQDAVVQEEVAVWEATTAHIDQTSSAMASLPIKGRPQRLTKSAPGKVEKAENDKKKKGKKSKKEKKGDVSASEENSTLITTVLSTPLSTAIQDEDGNLNEYDNENDETLKITNLEISKPQTKSVGSLETSTFVPPYGEEHKYILTKKIVDKMIKVPVIHFLSGEIDPNDPNLSDIIFFYFLRTTDEGIPQFSSWEMCNHCITDYLLIGSLHSNFLSNLNNILINVFQPLVEKQYEGKTAVQGKSNTAQVSGSSSTGNIQSVSWELSQSVKFSRATIENVDEPSEIYKSTNENTNKLINVLKINSQEFPAECTKKNLVESLEQLTSNVQWTLEHAREDVLLPLPNVFDYDSVDIQSLSLSTLDKNTVEQLEENVIAWGQHIEKILEAQSVKIFFDSGPLAEHEYWYDRQANLSILVEQLNTANVKKTLTILNHLGSAVASAFHWTEIELWKHYTQARDNNKFISIVLRYFKLLVESSDFKAISNAIPDLMEKLKMIWILSKYYSSEEKMTMLLERISWQLCENIRKNLSVKEIFRKPLGEALQQSMDACAMMKGWKIAYLETRQSIELSEKGVRWEMDQPRLFRQTEYIAKVCDDIYKIINVLEDFYNIFGIELKSIINDPAQIDDIAKRIHELLIPIQNTDFNIFTEANKENWDATMNWFYLQVSYLENEAKFFIDESFNVLINAEQALDVLLKFKTIKTRESIQQQLQIKFDVIMQQFSKEIIDVENIFNSDKKYPPLLRYHPPIAGAIFWARQLLNRLRGPIFKFEIAEEYIDPHIKVLTFTQYSQLANQMKNYEEMKFLSWIEKVDSQVISAMEKNILRLIGIESNTRHTQEKMISKVVGDKLMAEMQLFFEVNFDWQVFEVIHEAEMLEQMGFELLPCIRELGIQKDRIRADIKVTQAVINQYNEIIKQLDFRDIKLLKKIIKNVEKHILCGVIRFNWYSLTIADYAATCKKLLKNLASLVNQVQQIKRDLDHQIKNDICSYNLFTTSNDSALPGYQLTHCKWYFADIESMRTKIINLMLKSYQSISLMLIKLESLVEGTSTGRSLAMNYFYEYYEKQFFICLVTCCVQNLEILNKLLAGKKIIFLVDTILIASEVFLYPSPIDICTIILRNVNDLFNRCRQFARWMSGTCHEYKVNKTSDENDFITFSFYEDIVGIQAINDQIIVVHETCQKLALECWLYLLRWRKYENLWSSDKQQICKKFVAKNLTLHEFDEKFTFYDRIIEEINDTVPYYDVSSVRINLEPLFKNIRKHAQEWKQILGNYLISDTRKSMDHLKLTIKSFQSEIKLVINDLECLKIVMSAVASIKKMAIQVEMQYNEYQETFRILNIHGIKYSREDEDRALKLQQDWQSLYFAALFRTTTLKNTIESLSKKMQVQISEFLAECQALSENFNINGPGNVGQDLDIGLKKMEDFRSIINSFEAKRLDLLTAELLFNLPPENYSIFLRVKEEFENMEMIYSVYQAQKSARDVWSKTLWLDLDPQQLIDGIDEFLKQFQYLPETVKQLNIGQTLEATMKTFKNSISLLVKLKNEAMRERHWKELMEKTGKHFVMVKNRLD